MHRSILAIAASSALIISGPAYAQKGHGGGKPTSPSATHGPTTKPTSSGATTHGQSGSHGPATKPTSAGATTHGKSGSHGPMTKPTSSGTTATHGKSSEVHGASTKHADTTTTKSPTSTSTTSTGTTNTAAESTTTLTPVQQKLQKNSNLADKLKSRLPEGTDLMKASEGFKNLGQFVAAVNVSNNLGLNFTDLKTRMVDEGMSLGQAIQDVKKTSNVDAEVTRAETEADSMIKSSTTTTSTSTSTSTTPTTSTKKTKKSTGDK